MLIANQNPMGFEEALEEHKKDLLNFTLRICIHCGEIFNIQEKGIFYWCGCEK